jgi:hypothetical protein
VPCLFEVKSALFTKKKKSAVKPDDDTPMHDAGGARGAAATAPCFCVVLKHLRQKSNIAASAWQNHLGRLRTWSLLLIAKVAMSRLGTEIARIVAQSKTNML